MRNGGKNKSVAFIIFVQCIYIYIYIYILLVIFDIYFNFKYYSLNFSKYCRY